jgi:hypothetical protein
MAQIDELVMRTVDAVTTMTRRITSFTTIMLLGVTVVCIGGLLLGVEALAGGIETVWIVLGITFGALAIGTALIALWRVGSVRRHSAELAEEVRQLISEGGDGSRTVIDTFVVDVDPDDAPRTSDRHDSTIDMTRRMHGFRQVAGSGLDKAPRLAAAVAALTTFPILLFVAISITFVFAVASFFFLVALAL